MKQVTYLILVLIFNLLPSFTQAGEPPTEPIIRIETGMHTGKIGQIGLDAQNRYLVSGAADKTIRVWELPTMKLLRVIRPPIGPGNEGVIGGVAISPDGTTVAAGGWTRLGSNRGSTIYFFDRETGAMKNGIFNLPASIQQLVWSQDGKYLAAALFQRGVYVFHVSNNLLVGKDSDYGKGVYGADIFTKDGVTRLITTSDDGFLRLYSIEPSGLILHDKKSAQDGKEPCRVVFSPDGKNVVVGFKDAPKVTIYSVSEKLEYLFSPDTSGINNGQLGNVTWSMDGTTIFAGGSYSFGDSINIVLWPDFGRGDRLETPASSNTVMYIAPLKAGGVVYVTGDSALGFIGKDGMRTMFLEPPVPDYRLMFDIFKGSVDATTIQFGYKFGGKYPAIFSLRDKSLKPSDGTTLGLEPPKTDGLDITDWRGTRTPKFNGVPISLKEHEKSLCLAVLPDRSGFVLGTTWYVRQFDKNGKERWNVPTPYAWAVNTSLGGKIALVALGDGTIRWLRMSDGKELLAFFPAVDRTRWVVWTPKGYYDASPGADELIGWHVNNGKDKTSSFYPVSRFFEQFYRPDVISEVINSLDDDDVVVARLGSSGKLDMKQNFKRPPKVSFVYPNAGHGFETESVEVTVRAEDLGGGIDEINLFANGKVISSDSRGLKLIAKGATKEKTFLVQLTEGNNILKASAFSTDRVESNPVEITVQLKGIKQTSDLHLFIVGINKYKNPDLNLNYAGPDAQGVETFFTQPAVTKLFSKVHTHKLIDGEATTANIRKLFSDVQAKARPQDTVIVYFAGHGDSIGLDWFFVPHNIVTPEDENALKKDGLSTKNISEAVKSFASQKIFVILDACKSGGAVVAMRGFEERKALLQLARSTGTYILSASTDKQLAAEVQKLGHGAFTYVLLEGLGGKAGNKKVTVEGLITYVKDQLPEVTEKYRGSPQYSVSWGSGMDFPLAVHE